MMCDDSGKSKLSCCSAGLALGVLKGLFLLLLAWVAHFAGYGSGMVEHVAVWYHSYDASFMGGLIGGAYGFIAGFIFGYIFAYLYNFFLCRCCGKCS